MIGTCCLIFIIFLLPPLGVFFMRGCGVDFWINVCLTILGYLPGHIHAFYVLVRDREQKQMYGHRLHHHHHQQYQPQPHHHQQHHHHKNAYGNAPPPPYQ